MAFHPCWYLRRAVLVLALLLPTLAYSLPRVVAGSLGRGGPSPAGSYVLVHLSQDLTSHEVTIRVEEASSPEDALHALERVRNWTYLPPEPGTTEAPAGLVLFASPDESGLVEHLVPPKLRRPKNPTYPERLLQQGYQGRVSLQGLLPSDGRPVTISVRDCTHPAFGAAAAQVWGLWRYSPATWKGQPVTLHLHQSFHFSPGADKVTFEVPGRPALPEDRARLEAGEELKRPQVARYSLPAHPLELGPIAPPQELKVGVIIEPSGRIHSLHVDEVPEPWREHVAAIMRTWAFYPAVLSDRRVPWVAGFRLAGETSSMDLVRRALERNDLPQASELDRPPVLIAEIHPPFLFSGEQPPPDTFADLEMLVDTEGIVVGTRVLETNHAQFAAFARSRAAYSIFEPAKRNRRTTAFWVQRRFALSDPTPAAEPEAEEEKEN